METTGRAGYDVCYLGARQSVSRDRQSAMIDSPVPLAESTEARWLAWGRSIFAVVVVVVLVVLGIANVAMYSRWHEVEDGVLWSARAEGLTASEVVPNSAAEAVGIQRGDVLLAVNGVAVATPADVIEYQHQSQAGTRLNYTLLRLGT